MGNAFDSPGDCSALHIIAETKSRKNGETVSVGSRGSGTVTGTNAYDGMGNPTTYRGRTNTYDLPGRMATTRDGNTSVGYTYRADGLMASRAKSIYVQLFGNWVEIMEQPKFYLHDGGEPVLEMDLGTNYSTVVATELLVQRLVSVHGGRIWSATAPKPSTPSAPIPTSPSAPACTTARCASCGCRRARRRVWWRWAWWRWD